MPSLATGHVRRHKRSRVGRGPSSQRPPAWAVVCCGMAISQQIALGLHKHSPLHSRLLPCRDASIEGATSLPNLKNFRAVVSLLLSRGTLAPSVWILYCGETKTATPLPRSHPSTARLSDVETTDNCTPTAPRSPRLNASSLQFFIFHLFATMAESREDVYITVGLLARSIDSIATRLTCPTAPHERLVPARCSSPGPFLARCRDHEEVGRAHHPRDAL